MILKKALEGYNSLVARYPFTSSAITTGLVLFLGDLGAQKLEGGGLKAKINWKRSGKMIAWGVACTLPLYYWFRSVDKLEFLDRGSKYIVPLKKSAWTNAIFSPIINSAFFSYIIATEEEYSGWNEFKQLVKNKLKRDFKPMYIASLKVWVPVVYGLFVFVPPDFRVIVNNSIAMVWTVYLSWLGHRPNVEEKDSDV